MSASIRFDGFVGPRLVTVGVAVALSNFDNTGIAGWEWTLLDKPSGSAAIIGAPNAAATSFTPDLPGTYLVKLRTFTDAGRTILDAVDQDAAYIRLASPYPWRIPAAGETVEVDATRGWAAEVNQILSDIHAKLHGGTKNHLRVGDQIVVLTDHQYITKGSLTVDAGASFVLQPGAAGVAL